MRRFRRWLRRRRRRLLFLVMRQLMRVVGFSRSRRIGRWLADMHFLLAWRVRRRCERDLAGLFGKPPGDPAIRAMLKQSYRVTTIAVLEALSMFDRRLPDDVLAAQCEVTGVEHLRSVLAEGRGAILLAAHMGNGAMVVAQLARAGFPVSVVYRQARMMSADIFEGGLPLYGIEAIQANTGIRAYARMLDALKRGRVVYSTMDQGTKFDRDGIVVRFLGKDLPMSAGPAQLMRHSRAPMVPLVPTAMDPVWRFTIGAPIPRVEGATLESDVARLAQVNEQHILHYPELWSWHHRRWRRFPLAPTTG